MKAQDRFSDPLWRGWDYPGSPVYFSGVLSHRLYSICLHLRQQIAGFRKWFDCCFHSIKDICCVMLCSCSSR